KAAVHQGAGARGQHQRLRRAGSWSPADSFRQLRVALAGPGSPHEIEDRLDNALSDRRAPHEALSVRQIVSRHDRLRPRLALPGRFDQDATFGRTVWIADVYLQEKPVQLGLRQ